MAGTYTQVAAGQRHSLALQADGSLWAWGGNNFGQLGSATNSGNNTANPVPAQVAGTYTQVAAGFGHSLALRADGTLYTWGYNSDGQLGNGSTSSTPNPTPTQEATLGTGWTTLGTGVGASFSLVRTASAQNFASAGWNNSSQLGDGTNTSASHFDRVSPLRSLQPLPVTLVSFSAVAEGPSAVRLTWVTTSEQNSQAFEVERSLDGAVFARLGTVAAAGSSTAPRYYGFTDNQVPKSLSLQPRVGASQVSLYFRLRLVDADGTFSYSPVRAVALGGAAGLALYPNPAHAASTLAGAQPGAVVTVHDALGRPVTSATADAAGTAALALPAGLPAGVYVVRAGARSLRLAVE